MIKYLIQKIAGAYRKMFSFKEYFEVDFKLNSDEFTESNLYEQQVILGCVPQASFTEGIKFTLLLRKGSMTLDDLITAADQETIN